MHDLLLTAAEAADDKLHFTKRPDRAKFTASTLTQTLVLGFLAHPDARIEQLTHTAARLGVDVSPQAIDQRFSFDTAALLREVLASSMHDLIAAERVAIPILQRFQGVRVHDSTTITLPDSLAEHWRGCGGSDPEQTAAALKCGVQFDLLTGALCGLDLADGRASDKRLAVQHQALPKGSLRLADLGFYDLRVLAELTAHEVFWLSRLEPTALLRDEQGQSQSLLAFVHSLGACAQWEGPVWVGKEQRLHALAACAGAAGSGRSAATATAGDRAPKGTPAQRGSAGAGRVDRADNEHSSGEADAGRSTGAEHGALAD